MNVRAKWKGSLRVADASVPIKLYSAIQDHDIHFRMLYREDLTPVSQAMVHPVSNEIAPHDKVQRGYEASSGELVLLRWNELESLALVESRDVSPTRFVPVGAIALGAQQNSSAAYTVR